MNNFSRKHSIVNVDFVLFSTYLLGGHGGHGGGYDAAPQIVKVIHQEDHSHGGHGGGYAQPQIINVVHQEDHSHGHGHGGGYAQPQIIKVVHQEAAPSYGGKNQIK